MFAKQMGPSRRKYQAAETCVRCSAPSDLQVNEQQDRRAKDNHFPVSSTKGSVPGLFETWDGHTAGSGRC